MDEARCKALYKAAEAMICLSNYKVGEVLYRRYLESCPEIPGAWHGLAICLETNGDREGALKAYERALELNIREGSPSNLLWGGWCALKLGKVELAYRLFKESIRKDPSYAYTWHSLAIAAMRLGKRDEAQEAMSIYRALIKAKPYDKRECEGLAMLKEALNMDPTLKDTLGETFEAELRKHGPRCGVSLNED